MLQGAEHVAAHARALRRQMSPPEVSLRAALRLRPAGLKFRRQHPSGPYVADFYCHAARLVIEVDGEAHGRGDRPMRDGQRDSWFAERGLETIRITAADVLQNREEVVRHIVAAASARCSRED